MSLFRVAATATLLGVIALATSTAAASLPNPYEALEGARLGPAPYAVVEQVFWVQVPLPPETEVRVQAPEGLALIDQTRPGPGRKFTRLYFRADRPVREAEVVLTPAGAEPMRVPLTVRSYREDIEAQTASRPELDPKQAKLGRSYYDDEVLSIARENLKNHPKLGDAIKAATRFDRMSDEELWSEFPSWNVPRNCYSNWPCPDCGASIFKHSGFYPWQRTGQRFKCKCPDCGKLFPSNDFAGGDLTSGDTPDDGWGFDPGTGKRDEFAAWIGYWSHHQVWQQGGRIRRLGLRYLLFGDEQAAHRAAILLARIAYVYPGMDMRWQQVHSTYLRPGRALIDGNWERNNLLVPLLQTYDAIFEAIDHDQALVDFLKTKDPTIQTPADVKRLFDMYLVQLFGWDWMYRGLSGGNQGQREKDFANMILCANIPQATDIWLKELFTHAYNSGTNKGGVDDQSWVNNLTREGITVVNGLGYALGYLSSKSDAAYVFSRINHPTWTARTNLYDPEAYPKLRAEYDAWIDMLCAGQFGPQYGDSGAARAARYPKGIIAGQTRHYLRAYGKWPTDKIARALADAGSSKPQLFERDVWPQVQRRVADLGPQPPAQSRVLDGTGFAILESRPQAEQLEDRAAIALRYGYGIGHHHHDNLNVEMWAHNDSVSPELGYPCWTHPMGNTSFVAHHNTGMIDHRGQYSGGIGKGALEMFAAAPEASFADVSSEPNGFPNRMYRRAVCLADAPDGNVYLLDILRLAGGKVRTYCFHGPAFDGFGSSLKFGEKQPGAWQVDLANFGRRLQPNILDPQNAASDGDAWADWACDNNDMNVRLTMLGEQGRRYVTARCAKSDLPPLRYLFAEDEAEDGASQFVALWEPYVGRPFIQSIEKLSVQGVQDAEYQPVALRVSLAGGQVDTFIYSQQPDAELTVGELTFQGSFGYWSELDNEPRCAHLVNGTTLRTGDAGIAGATARYEATVTSVDHTNKRVTLDQRLPTDGSLEGLMIHFRFGPHRTAYKIVKVLEPGNVVQVDLDALIYRSRVDEVAQDGTHLIAELDPRLPPSGGANPHGYYDGALATNEAMTAVHRVVSTQGTTIHLDPPASEGAFTDTDGDGREMVKMYDYGPGDAAVVYVSVFRQMR